eukprot:2595454-Rhodomonas_salina.2
MATTPQTAQDATHSPSPPSRSPAPTPAGQGEIKQMRSRNPSPPSVESSRPLQIVLKADRPAAVENVACLALWWQHDQPRQSSQGRQTRHVSARKPTRRADSALELSQRCEDVGRGLRVQKERAAAERGVTWQSSALELAATPSGI